MEQREKGKADMPARDEIVSGIRKAKGDSSGDNDSSSIHRAARILLVDDEQDITAIIKKGLQQFGYQINTFNSPALALSQFKAGSYDIALLDVRMPQMSGFELCKKLQQVDGNLLVRFMTAFEMYETDFKETFPNYDFNYFIRKPIKVSSLAKQLESITASSSSLHRGKQALL